MAPSEATGHIPCAMQRSPSGPGRELRAPARRRGARVPPHRRGGRGGSRPRLGQRGVPRAQRLGAQRTGDGLRPARGCGSARPRSAGGLWREPDMETILPGAHRCRATRRSESGSARPAPSTETRHSSTSSSSGTRGSCGRGDARSWSSTSESTQRCSTTAVRSGSPVRSRTPIARGGRGERVFRGPRSPSIRRSTGREGRSSVIDRRPETWLSLFQRRMS